MNAIPLAAQGDFQPEHEFEVETWVDLGILSINKVVVYLWVGAAVTIILGIWIMRFGLSLRPSRKQTMGESVYELVQGQIAEGNLPSKAIGKWFPYVASLFGVEIPTFGLYAATSSLSVTLALALITFVATHYEGIRYNGVRRYFKSWIPSGVPRALLPMITVLEVISQFMRLISLSVRLFANMLAGHMLILVMLGLIIIFETAAAAIIAVPVATGVYIFEVAIVVTIQAFVFALLSAIYIGGAIEPEH
jgi:F-type H+-transporting ATPase subunit a